MAALRACALVLACGAFALYGRAAAIDGDGDDAAMARALAACPGAAKAIEGHRPDPQAGAPRPADAAPSDPALRGELLRMARSDQDARRGDLSDPEVAKRMAAVDAANLPRLRAIVAERGFPGTAMVGQDGFNAAWLLVQHADADPAFQERILDTLTARGDLGGEQLALLTDRVLRAQGKPQRYGSQMQDGGNGRWALQPMDGSRAEVDRRRAALGMMPLADYECMIGEIYASPKASPPPATEAGKEERPR